MDIIRQHVPDDEEVADNWWLRGKVIKLLQGYLAPGVIGDSEHAIDMIRARRILRRMEVRPVTETTVFEQVCARRAAADVQEATRFGLAVAP